MLDTLELKIKTGQRGLGRTPGYAINSHEIAFDQVSGGTGPGDVLMAVGSPRSFPHSLSLTGPDEGVWDIEHIALTFHAGEQPYTVHLGAVTLDSESKLNLWYDRPPLLLDV